MLPRDLGLVDHDAPPAAGSHKPAVTMDAFLKLDTGIWWRVHFNQWLLEVLQQNENCFNGQNAFSPHRVQQKSG